MATFSNWPNELTIPWSGRNDVFGHSNQVIFFMLPWILLLFIFLFRRQLGKVDIKVKKWLWSGMGLFAIGWEFWFDLSSITVGGQSPAQQFWNGLDFCRLNMYLIGVFLLFRKIEWVKWLVATALWGGASTLFNHYDKTAAVHSLITHGIVLPTFPALAISMARTNYSFKSYVYAHLFNWSIVILVIIVNYTRNETHGELQEAHLEDNALVGWAPYGMRILLWILVVMVVEFCYFMFFRLIFWKTYAPKMVKKTLFKTKVLRIKINSHMQLTVGRLSFSTYKRAISFKKDLVDDFKESIKLIPFGPKRTYQAAISNCKMAIEFSKTRSSRAIAFVKSLR